MRPSCSMGVAVVLSAPRSLPASGSVAPYANSRPSSAMRVSHSFCWSAVAPTAIGSLPRAVASTLVAPPRSMAAIFSQTRHTAKLPPPTPPYYSGTNSRWMPRSSPHILWTSSTGHSSSWSSRSTRSAGRWRSANSCIACSVISRVSASRPLAGPASFMTQPPPSRGGWDRWASRGPSRIESCTVHPSTYESEPPWVMGQRSRANPTMVPMPREDDGIATAGRRRLRRLAGLGRADAVRPHHLVVLVFDDVAVPHELARSVEPDAYPGDLPGICDDGVLEPDLPRLRWLRGTRGSHGLSVFVHDDVLAVHHLEVHLVDVHGVGVLRRVVELPHLGRTDGRVLAHRVHPQPLGPHPRGDVWIAGDGAEQGLGGAVVERRRLLEQGQPPGDGRRQH